MTTLKTKARIFQLYDDGLKELIYTIVAGGVLSMITKSFKNLLTVMGLVLLIWNCFDLTQTIQIIIGKRAIWADWQGVYIAIDFISLFYVGFNFLNFKSILFKIVAVYLFLWSVYYCYLDMSTNPMFQPNFDWFNWFGVFMNVSMLAFICINEGIRHKKYFKKRL